jgi:hypothetical protein
MGTNIFYINLSNIFCINNLLLSLLANNFVLSVLFWNNPIEKSLIHKFDAFFARLSISLFSFYVFFLKHTFIQNKIYYLFFLMLSMKFFYNGTYYSQQKWCCDKHILNHMFFHLFIGIGVSYAFIL